MIRSPDRRPRPGLTLVEMMVAAALIIFIMYILTAAFQVGSDTFRTLKAAGDQQTKLRLASNILRDDLNAAHFDVTDGPNLSDQRLDLPDYVPPKRGYFRIVQDRRINTNYFYEPEADAGIGFQSWRATGDILAFTVNLGPGANPNQYTAGTPFNPRARFFSTGVANQATAASLASYMSPRWAVRQALDPASPQFVSEWAELAYFLKPTGLSANGTPLFGLYRRQKLLAAPDVSSVGNNRAPSVASSAFPTDGRFVDMSTWNDGAPPATSKTEFNRPEDVTAPLRRFAMIPNVLYGSPPGGYAAATSGANQTTLAQDSADSNRFGDDLVMPDVLSFEVKVAWENSTTGAILPSVYSYNGNAGTNAYPNLPNSAVGRVAAFADNPQFSNTKPVTGYANGLPNVEYPFGDLPELPTDGAFGYNFTVVNQTLRSRFAPYGGTGPTDVRVFDTWSRESRVGLPGTQYDYTAQDFNVKDASNNPLPPDVQRGSQFWNDLYWATTDPRRPAALNTLDPNYINLTIPLRIRVRGVQIRLRIWDFKAQAARQITLVQDL